jgi:hypothetical protein
MKPDPHTTPADQANRDLPEEQRRAARIPLDPLGDDETSEVDASMAANDSVVEDMPPAEPDATYSPPTDPVVGYDEDGDLEVIGGFAATAMSENDIDVASDHTYGDEAMGEAIQRELHEDAATTDLTIAVYVEDGVAYLQGAVPTLEDAQNAEDVASRIPGIREVVEDLDIAEL